MKHTPQLLRIAGRETRGLPHTLVAANTLLFRVYSEAFGDVDQEIANARRLVACWNACHALKTETIEKGGGVFDILVKVAGQRDELLQALKQMLDAFYHDPLGGGLDAAIEAALDAVAKAEGAK